MAAKKYIAVPETLGKVKIAGTSVIVEVMTSYFVFLMQAINSFGQLAKTIPGIRQADRVLLFLSKANEENVKELALDVDDYNMIVSAVRDGMDKDIWSRDSEGGTSPILARALLPYMVRTLEEAKDKPTLEVVE
jgi:hypothetical protein